MKKYAISVIAFLIATIVYIGLAAIGVCEPDFGWFLSQPVVEITISAIYIGFGVWTMIQVIETAINSSSKEKEQA